MDYSYTDHEGFMSQNGSGITTITGSLLSSSDDQHNKHLKIAIVGARNVGKTSIVVRYIESRFLESYYPTYKENHFNVTVPLVTNGVDGTINAGMGPSNSGNYPDLHLEIIDTIGQDIKDSSNLNINYWKSLINLNGCILCYNINNFNSFRILRSLWDKIVNQLELPNGNKFPLLIIGNKYDDDAQVTRQVSREQGQKLAKELNAIFFECSAKDDYNIDAAIRSLLTRIEIEKGILNANGEFNNKCIVM